MDTTRTGTLEAPSDVSRKRTSTLIGLQFGCVSSRAVFGTTPILCAVVCICRESAFCSRDAETTWLGDRLFQSEPRPSSAIRARNVATRVRGLERVVVLLLGQQSLPARSPNTVQAHAAGVTILSKNRKSCVRLGRCLAAVAAFRRLCFSLHEDRRKS